MSSHEYESIAHFDAAAASWDENAVRRAMTEAIAKAIRATVPLRREMRALEYGCGTATLSILLADSLGEVVAADASAGMIDQVRQKIERFALGNLRAVQLDLSQERHSGGAFDLIMTAMALHHMPDVRLILGRMAEMLAPEGWLAIVDLVEEDGTFHRDVKVPHNGFSQGTLGRMLEELRFTNLRWQVAYQVERNDRFYDIFLLSAKRP